MQSQAIFYVIGIVFVFFTIAYFTYEYLFSLSNLVKTIILVCLTIGTFFLAEVFSERDW